MKLTIHLQLVMRLGIIGSMPPLPYTSLCYAQGKINRWVVTKCVSGALGTLRANQLRWFLYVETEKIGEGKAYIR